MPYIPNSEWRIQIVLDTALENVFYLVDKTDDKLYWIYVARLWWWWQGSSVGDFCGKLPEVSPISGRGNASQLQDGHHWPKPSPSLVVRVPLG